MDQLQQIRDEVGNDPDKALEALERVSEWIGRELPIPTTGATVMLVRISAAISVLKDRTVFMPADPSMDLLQTMHEAMFISRWDATQAIMIGAGYDAARKYLED